MGDEENKQRRYAKASLTRLINKTDKFIVENDVPGLKSHMEKMKEAFQKFESAHERYHELLETEAQQKESDDYLFEEQNSYIGAMKKGNDYLKDVEVKANDMSEVGLQDIVQTFNFPKVELEEFTGDPLMYPSFKAMIKETIDPLKFNDKIKVTRLLQYSHEDVKKQIRHCMNLESGDAYEEAKKNP